MSPIEVITGTFLTLGSIAAAIPFGLEPRKIIARRILLITAAVFLAGAAIVEVVFMESQMSLPKRMVLCAFFWAIIGAGLTWGLAHIKEKMAPDLPSGPKGGDASVKGHRSGAVGGSAGDSGSYSQGGPGGDARVEGDDSYARGGDGGNGADAAGRGARRTLSPGERENLPTSMWPYGYGGGGGNTPEYDRRIKLLTQIRQEYLTAFPDDAVSINAGVDAVPLRWINKRLEELNETWRVELDQGGYKMPPLSTDK